MKHYLFVLCVLTATCVTAATALSAMHNHPPVIAGNVYTNNYTYSISPDTPAIAHKLLTPEDAKKIMGEPCRLDSSTYLKKPGVKEYKCEYTARAQDAVTGKTGKLYFMYEIYNSSGAAAKVYAEFYNGNASSEGVEKVTGLGTQAYYHTDHTGFYFFLVRKNEKMFRVKLNKITSHSSETAFKTAAKNIVDRL